MKILLMGVQKLKFMPYMNFYLSQLDLIHNDVHLLYWNRDMKEEKRPDFNITYHEFKCYQEDEVPKVKKIKSFMKYRKAAKQLILEENFDLIIVLNTVSGFLLQDFLWKNYSKKYIFDYRDPTLENIHFYKFLIGIIAKKSLVTFVSSDGFRKFLPKIENIFTSHNILLDSLHYRDVRLAVSREVSPIRVRYWGMIRDESINRTIIDRLANDKRFELHYHGRMQKTGKNLEEYCQSNGIRNVFFHGVYSPEERYEFAKETDILHNIYEKHKLLSRAMGNKFYDGIVHYIPQICNEDSYMGEKVESEKVGAELDPNDLSFADKLYHYYLNINWKEFNERCDSLLSHVLQEYQSGNKIINDIIHKNEVSQIKERRQHG
ncbi:hypothetical protein [Bacillus sp. B15-48]|uniref:hypothetical protein n=1 Tax=Bacillus sp. B15-48 TaxID=1548601 RepID=UPI00193F0759|nr:hypothetical protein [Bacillus sp. B15-48]MBM4764483.1 hypothetical protein [Bacillus sp. B15-48]